MSLLFVTIYKHFKYGESAEQDDRMRKIMYRAFAGSWFAILLLTAILMLADYLGVLKLTVQGALSVIFFGMIITSSAFNCTLEEKVMWSEIQKRQGYFNIPRTECCYDFIRIGSIDIYSSAANRSYLGRIDSVHFGSVYFN